MSAGAPVRRALLSVAPFEELPAFAERLHALDCELIATSDARAQLLAAGIPCRDVAEFNRVPDEFTFPPTLHARMEAALTGDVAANDSIDLVFDVPYGPSEGNDVGGHTLLALAAKGHRLPVSSPDQLDELLSALERDGSVDEARRQQLELAAYSRCAEHYAALAHPGARSPRSFEFDPITRLESGENPYQQPAHLARQSGCEDPLGLPQWKQETGTPPCFTNLADMDALLETFVRLHNALRRNAVKLGHIAIAAKHGNACGIGIHDDAAKALDLALNGDPLSIWGGELIVDAALDAELAEVASRSEARRERLGSPFWMLDLVLAPGADATAISRLAKNPRRKLLVNDALANPTLEQNEQFRQVRGGALLQPPGNYVLDLGEVNWNTTGVSPNDTRDLCIAWATAYTTSAGGNEVALAKDGQLLALGGGPSTVQAAELAIARARRNGHDPTAAVFAADAFFPMTDAPQLLIEAGCRAGVVPGGGKRHAEVCAHFAAADVPVAFLAEDLRGFCRH